MADRARDYQPGERVPGTVYQVVRLIGAGGMGTVYDVEDTTISKRYVLKTLHPQLGAREDLARRMQNEARTLARLHHPNIVDVFTAGVTQDDLKLPYYVMERLDGKSLRYVLDKQGQLELPHAYNIAIDLLDALDHAHDKGVIHRDVKPDNIFLHRTSAGVTVTKLLDFGIMSLLDATARETAGRFLGTLRYAAPEQLRGDKPTPKVDVYAAALVLFEMVAGRGPFDDAGQPHRVAASHLHTPAPLLSHFVVVPPELDSLVNAALQKLPEHRPRDAFSFAASLRNLKRSLAGARGQESTENRPTDAAVVGPGSRAAPYVHVRQPSPEGPYVIQPGPPQTPPGIQPTPPGMQPTPPGMQPAAAARTTMRGMMPPSVAPPSGLPTAPAPTATSPAPVDRGAATHSIVAASPHPVQGGTGALAPAPPGSATPGTLAPTLASDAAPPSGDAQFKWPAVREASVSDDPHVRTLSHEPGARRRSAAPVVAGVLLMGALAASSVVLVVVRARGGPGRVSASRAPSSVVAAASEPPRPEPVVVLPAPTLAPPAPPALDPSPPTAGASAPVVSTASVRPATKAPVSAAQAPVPTPKPASAGLPGPGF
jgi:serine/threonine-protein kinase